MSNLNTPSNPPLTPELEAQAAAINGGKPLPNQADLVDDEVSDDTAYRMTLTPIIGVMCAVFCPNWQIQPQEQGAIIEALVPVAKKYMPNATGALPVEIGALLTVAIIVTPRLTAGLPPRIIEVKEEEKLSPEDEAAYK